MQPISEHLELALLAPDIGTEKIREGCAQARRFCLAAVNVPPYYVAEAAEALRGSTVLVGTSAGIPNSTPSMAAKLAEVKECVACGAKEIDVPINALAVKSGRMDDARRELFELLELARGRAVVRPAFEHAIFTDLEKEAVLSMIKKSGAEWIKIQNVLSGQGAETPQVAYARALCGGLKIKIDGGVKTLSHARELLAAGAERLGTSAALAIIAESE